MFDFYGDYSKFFLLGGVGGGEFKEFYSNFVQRKARLYNIEWYEPRHKKNLVHSNYVYYTI